MSDVVLSDEVLKWLASADPLPDEDGVRRIWLEIARGPEGTRIQFRRVGDGDFPKRGVGHYFDTSPVFWYSKDLDRAQFDSLTERARFELPPPTYEGLPEPLRPKPFLKGTAVVTFPSGLTHEQMRELHHAVGRLAPDATAEFIAGEWRFECLVPADPDATPAPE